MRFCFLSAAAALCVAAMSFADGPCPDGPCPAVRRRMPTVGPTVIVTPAPMTFREAAMSPVLTAGSILLERHPVLAAPAVIAVRIVRRLTHPFGGRFRR